MNSAAAYELPLFPLNTVLFPGMPLPLHIFEPRYKELVRECLRDQKPFGVVLIKSGVEVGQAAEPFAIGTSTRIRAVKRLSDGRLNIDTVGQDRFRVLELRYHRPYLSALVEDYPLAGPGSPEAATAAERLRPWVARYLELLARAAETTFNPQRLPDDPVGLACLAAVVLQTPPLAKQQLLAIPATLDLLVRERAIYRTEIALLSVLVRPQPADTASFSPN